MEPEKTFTFQRMISASRGTEFAACSVSGANVSTSQIHQWDMTRMSFACPIDDLPVTECVLHIS